MILTNFQIKLKIILLNSLTHIFLILSIFIKLFIIISVSFKFINLTSIFLKAIHCNLFFDIVHAKLLYIHEVHPPPVLVGNLIFDFDHCSLLISNIYIYHQNDNYLK